MNELPETKIKARKIPCRKPDAVKELEQFANESASEANQYIKNKKGLNNGK